jgi:transcriptional regulator with GAF, ATPase, and Fis domain
MLPSATIRRFARVLRYVTMAPGSRSSKEIPTVGQAMIGEADRAGGEQDRLFELILRLSSRIDQPTLAEDIVCSIASYWSTGVAALVVLDPSAERTDVTSLGLTEADRERLEKKGAEALASLATAASQVQTLAQIGIDHGAAMDEGLVPSGFGDACYLPLRTPAGTVVGALALYFEEPGAASRADLQPFTLLGPLLAQYLFTSRAHAAVKQSASRFRARARKQRAIAEAFDGIPLTTSAGEVLVSAARIGTRWISAEGCVIDAVGPDGSILRSTASCRNSDRSVADDSCVPSARIRTELIGQVRRTGMPVIVRGSSAARLEVPDALDSPERWDELCRTTVLCLPLVGSGEMIGALTISRHEAANEDPEEDVYLASEVARHTSRLLAETLLNRSPPPPSR